MTTDNLFNWNNVIIIGWLALIFAPFSKTSKYFVQLLAIILSIFYSMNLLETLSKNSFLDVFQLSKWLTQLTSRTNHLCLLDLLLGKWMINDFYSGFTCAYSLTSDFNGVYQIKPSWTFGRLIFTLIMFITYLAGPFGFLLYQLTKLTLWKKYKTLDRIDFRNFETITTNQFQTDVLNRRYIRFGDQLSGSCQTIYRFLLGLMGLIVLFTIALPSYFILRIYCRFAYRSPSTTITPNKFMSEYVLNQTAQLKFNSILTPLNKRNFIWHLKYILLQLSTFIEYIPNSFKPYDLFKSLEDYFQAKYNVPYFVFGDGLAVNSYDLVKRYLQDLPPEKTYESLGWPVSSSQAKFCDFTTTFLSSDQAEMKLGRDIIFAWLHAFPYRINSIDNETRSHLSRLVPRKIDSQPDRTTVFQAVGEVMFFLATGGQMRQHERKAYIDCVKNPAIFFPNWFNFLLAGHYLERMNFDSYHILLQAFARHTHGPAIRAAFKVGTHRKSQIEILKLIAIVFAIAGSAAPAKLAYAVIERLWNENDRQKQIDLFKKNPKNFIKECARLDKVVPMVNILATDQIVDEIQQVFQCQNMNIQIPNKTPIHCSLVNANRDKTIFTNPDEFNPDRLDLDKIIIWNGVEEDIMKTDQTKRPVRYCPGHDLSLDIIQYIAEQFLPVLSSSNLEDNHPMISDENEQKLVSMKLHMNELTPDIDSYCYNALDSYTKVLLKLVQLAIQETNTIPARAIDISRPFDLPTRNLNIIRLHMAKFIPQWDEDIPTGAKFRRRIARWLVNIKLWSFHDNRMEFQSLEQAIRWRSKMFPFLPLPNIIYDDMMSDEAMSRLAFVGCACQYTHRIDETWHPGQGIPDEKFLANAVYVNDMTCLATFHVRKPYELYGAAAYFDKDFQLIAIYWSHTSRLIKKGELFWRHVKFVWRTSFFAYVTIRDHLIVTHMIEGNAFVMASRRCLPLNHPLRQFIKPFTYHNISINYQASVSLINERGLVHRIWAFEYDEFLKICDYISMNYKFRLLPDFISKTMYPEVNNKTNDEWEQIYPIYHDSNIFWTIIQNYVSNFFEINFNCSIENDHLPQDKYLIEFINEICTQLGIAGIVSLRHFIDVLSQLIVTSTSIHEHVGQVSDYLIDPRFVGTKLQEGKEIQDIQSYTQVLVLTMVTGLQMPGLLEDWSHLIEHDQYYIENIKNYQNFKKDLRDLSEYIDRRNKTTNYPFESFNPKYMQCSIST